jgi:hypothetical protein
MAPSRPATDREPRPDRSSVIRGSCRSVRPPRRNSPGKPDTVVTAWDRALPAIGCRGLAAGRSPYTADPRHSRSPDIVGAAERDLAVAARRFSQAVHVRRAAGVPADAGSVGPPRGIVTALSSGAVSAC